MHKTAFFHPFLRALLAGLLINQIGLGAQPPDIVKAHRPLGHPHLLSLLHPGAAGPEGDPAALKSVAKASLAVSVDPSNAVGSKTESLRPIGPMESKPGTSKTAGAGFSLPKNLTPIAKAKSAALLTKLGNRTATFIENRGQFDDQVKFQVRNSGKTVWLTNKGIVFDALRARAGVGSAFPRERRAPPYLDLRSPNPDPGNFERLVFSEDFVGAHCGPDVEGVSPQPGLYNYLIGNDSAKWRTDVRGFGGVIYRNLWDGVDLKLVGNGTNIEQEFVVHPGADLSKVQVAYRGIERLEVAKDGSLVIHTGFDELWESRPHIYQEIAGKRVPVKGRFKLTSETAYTFEVKSFKSDFALVIDPTLLYSTYLGGTGYDEGKGIAVDAAGNAYVTGRTNSTDFPTTPGSFQTTGSGIFVTKLSALGNSPLVYSTYLGAGSRAYAIAVDSADEAYVTGGYAGSDLPTTANAFQRDCNDSFFLTKLNAQGNGLIYSTCLGQGLAGIYGTGAYAVALDATGNAYLTGFFFPILPTWSFPTTAGAFQSQPPSPDDNPVVTVLNPSASGASSLVYSTYLGGHHHDYGPYASYHEGGFGIAVDSFGMLYVTGNAGSSDFPVTPGAFLTTDQALGCYASIGDRCPTAFVAKMNPRLSGDASLIYSTFLGGSTGTHGAAVAVDSSGNAYVTGYTGEWYNNNPHSVPFPTTPGAYQTTPDLIDAFVTKLNAAGNILIYSTLLGGNGNPAGVQFGTGIALDSSANAYVTGYTRAPDFPITPDGFPYPGGGGGYGFNAFVTKFNNTGTAPLIYSSYLGGATNDDVANGIAVDSAGDAYVTGYTSSLDFPVTSFAFQPVYRGATDAFVTKFPLGAPGALSITGIVPTSGGNAGSVTTQIVGTGFHNGATVKLAGGGEIPGNLVSVESGGRILRTTFNLQGATPGVRDLVVINPDGTSVTLSRAFSVQQGGAADVRISKIGTAAVRGRNLTHSITVSNVGQIDSDPMLMTDYMEPWFTFLRANPAPTTITQSDAAWPPDVVGTGATYDAMLQWLLPSVPTGNSQAFSYTVKLDASRILNGIIWNPPVCIGRDSSALVNCYLNWADCLLSRHLACHSLIGDPVRYLACLIAGDQLCHVQIENCVRTNGGGVCFRLREIMSSPADPNYLVGLPGVGDASWLSGGEPLAYSIVFENDGDAPTQQVVVTNPLDPNVDISTLRLTGLQIPDTQVPVPPGFMPAIGMNEVTTNVDLRPTQNLFVNIDAKLDPKTSVLTWTFTSIDPTTGQPPEDAGIGFLAPGAEGGVSFTVTPKIGLPTGTQISDQAAVVFDILDPVPTNILTNTLDNTPPTSQVAPLPPTESSTCFLVEWSGTDEGAGIQDFTIFVSDNGGPFTAWLTNTDATAPRPSATRSAIYYGRPGHAYGFYSQARDLVGNIEAARTSADTTTTVDPDAVCNLTGLK